MRIVETSEPRLADRIRGVPLSVVFADGESIAAVRDVGQGTLPLGPPFHVSDEDAYLVLPDDIGLEIVDIFRDGDLDLLAEAMRDGLVAMGSVAKRGRGTLCLLVETCERAASVLDAMDFGEAVGFGRGIDPIPLLNALEPLRCTVASEFIDEHGLERMLAMREQAGVCWRAPEGAAHLAGVDPTYAWSRRLPDGRIAIECALFSEYEELVAVLRPAVLVPLDRPCLSAASPTP